MPRLSRVTAVGAVFLAALVAGAWLGAEEDISSTLIEDFKLHGDGGGGGPGERGRYLGRSAAVDGDTAVVGAIGAVYVYVSSANGWVKQQRLTPANPELSLMYGNAVALSGDTALVGAYGAYGAGLRAGAAYVVVRDGETWSLQQELIPGDGAVGDQFGWSVALFGDVALVGAPWDDDAGDGCGSAYVFERSGGVWTQRQKLTAADGAEGDQFGGAVALSGATALVGARLDDDAGEGSGSVYAFVHSGGAWVEQQKLTTADAAQYDAFGCAVAVDGDTALVGAHHGEVSVSGSGSAYVFVRAGGVWSQQAELEASNAQAGAGFGTSVSLAGERAAVGAWYFGTGTTMSEAYVFARDGGMWSERASLRAEDQEPGDAFGAAVAISGTTVVVGANRQDAAGEDSGAAYVFAESGGAWSLAQKLLGDATADYDYFGFSVAESRGTLLVGAPHDGWGYESSVYVFERSETGWEMRQKLLSPAPGVYDWFGNSVAIRGDLALVGAPDDSDGLSWFGAAYVFTRAGGLWTERQKLRASAPQDALGFGVAVTLSADTLLVTAQETDSSGAVYVFENVDETWVETQRLRAAQPHPDDYFGGPCALEGDTILVGASGDDESATDAGAVYVFERHGGTWVEVQKLMASDAAEGDGLSWPALSGDSALVGAGGADDGAGAVYVFEREGGVWVERGRMTAEDPEPDSIFGAVSVAGDLAVVGAYRARCGGLRSGAAYLFQRSDGEWRQLDKLCPSDPIDPLLFGFPVALTGAEALVGAPFDDDDGWRSGSVYRFSVPLFTDGFESGGVGAWSDVIP